MKKFFAISIAGLAAFLTLGACKPTVQPVSDELTYEQILERDKTSLDISWIRSGDTIDDRSLAELLDEIEEKASNINSAVEALKSLIGDLEE